MDPPSSDEIHAKNAQGDDHGCLDKATYGRPNSMLINCFDAVSIATDQRDWRGIGQRYSEKTASECQEFRLHKRVDLHELCTYRTYQMHTCGCSGFEMSALTYRMTARHASQRHPRASYFGSRADR